MAIDKRELHKGMIVMISRKENDAINIYGRRNCPSYGIVSEEIVFINVRIYTLVIHNDHNFEGLFPILGPQK